MAGESEEFTTRLYAVPQVRELERRAIAGGVAGHTLMQRAAARCWQEVQRRWPAAMQIVIACGSGNNGGDGYEIARLARDDGRRVRVLQFGAAPGVNEAAIARRAWLDGGGAVEPFSSEALVDAELVIDALFGIGLSRELEGEARAAVEAINAAAAPVLSIDVPSGLDADRGSVRGVAVISAVCVSFIARKPGLHTGVGADHAGECVYDGLGLGSEIHSGLKPVARLLGETELRRALPRRRRSAHKGSHGHVLILGGNHGMAGAALLAGRAALRGGAGLVSVATRDGHAGALTAAQPELMCLGCEGAEDLVTKLPRANVLAIGPGLGRDDWARALLRIVLASALPLVLDADALNLLAEQPSTREEWVLTPHPGEAARLLGCSTAQVQQDRFAAARDLRERYGGVIVLKGAGTLVQGAELAVCADGNPGMGTGGMGDALTGVIAALIAQGLPTETAARVGVLAHARAADLAARGGERGLLPSDLIDALRTVLNPA